MIVGLALLLYVGVSYVRGNSSAAAPQRTRAERQQGKAIAVALAKRQSVAVPKRLLSSRAPAVGTELGTRIVIPKILVDSSIVETPVQNGTWPVTDWAVGHLPLSPNPGQSGNVALSAHDDIKGEVFKRIGELHAGDRILIYSHHWRFKYVVVGQQTVDPSNTSVLNNTKASTVTLITCVPYWVDTQRTIIQAALKSQSRI